MAKPRYHKWLEPDNLELIQEWAGSGMIDAQIAYKMGIDVRTLYRWRNELPEIHDAITNGKYSLNRELENNVLVACWDGEEYKPGTSVQMSVEDIVEELKKPCLYEFQGNEKEFEENIFINIDQICEALALPQIVAIERQKCIQLDSFQCIPDIIVRHSDGTITVFEVKKINRKNPWTGTSNQMNAVGQLLLYGNVIETITKVPVRLVLIDNKIYYRTYCAFVGHKLPITLVDFQQDRVFVPYCGWETDNED